MTKPLFRPLFSGMESQSTGPGPQTPIVDGFYGEVSSAELFSGDDLALLLGVTEGSPINSDAGWLKFAHNDKILFIAKQPFRHSITWEHLYSRGVVYGTDDTGKAPYGTPTNQLTKVSRSGSEFIVRLMTGANADPFDDTDPLFYPSTDMCQLNIGGGSEWNELMYRVHQLVPDCPATNHRADTSGGPQVGENWANYTDADIVVGGGLGRTSWCQEQAMSNSASRVYRGYIDVAYFYRTTATTVISHLGWRPVLELVTNN